MCRLDVTNSKLIRFGFSASFLQTETQEGEQEQGVTLIQDGQNEVSAHSGKITSKILIFEHK